jgi:four helix bundle protein
MDEQEIKSRTKTFALRVLKVVEALPKTISGKAVANQLIRSGTSVAANYRAACICRSKAEFSAKLGVVLEETDESCFWLEFITEGELLLSDCVSDLHAEGEELRAIFLSSIRTAKGLSKSKTPDQNAQIPSSVPSQIPNRKLTPFPLNRKSQIKNPKSKIKNWLPTLTLALLAGLTAPVAQAEVTVSNVTAAQRPGTKLVDITYDVTCVEPTVGWISLVVSNGAAAVVCQSVSGHVGVDVPTGTARSIVWDAGADWNGNVAADIEYIVRGVSQPVLVGDPTAVICEEVDDRWFKNTYTDGAITMIDRTTGIMWLYNADMLGTANWVDAKNVCINLTYAGYSDWFLPDRWQLHAMYSQKAVFSNVQNFKYWSSTQGHVCNATTGWNGYDVDMSNGLVDGYSNNYCLFGVWSCRLGQTFVIGASSSDSSTVTDLDTRDYTLTVASEHGNPTPSVGTHSGYCWHSTVNASVDAVGHGYACTGWIGTGAIPAFGSTNTTGAVTLNEVVSTITWQWTTNQVTQAVWYVSKDGLSTGHGTSWSTAYDTIQSAVDAASDGDMILVSNGVYGVASSINVNKAVVLRSVAGAENTIIDGDNRMRCFLVADVACVIDGFTIRCGYITSVPIINGLGAGVYCSSDIPRVENCIISDNYAGFSGAGMYQGTAVNCVFRNNHADYHGGGIYKGTARSCRFVDNYARGDLYYERGGGGGMSCGATYECVFEENQSSFGGGGIESGSANNCKFLYNHAARGGGAQASAVTNCLFIGNKATWGGGIMYGTANSCYFQNNEVVQAGGGIYKAVAYNCTIKENTASFGGGAYSSGLRNCIVWFNTDCLGNNLYGCTSEFTCCPEVIH